MWGWNGPCHRCVDEGDVGMVCHCRDGARCCCEAMQQNGWVLDETGRCWCWVGKGGGWGGRWDGIFWLSDRIGL